MTDIILISFMITNYILYQTKSYSLLDSCEMFAVGLFAMIACRNLVCNNDVIIVKIIFGTVKICCSDCVLEIAVCTARITVYSHICAFEPVMSMYRAESIQISNVCLLYMRLTGTTTHA